tara:strand:+ start:28 stop:423 length:396 start_codon:yes stop_codon:yes gene_type:complete
MESIKIPRYAKIKNYRTMTKNKKKLAVEGSKKHQLEWMKEEINEFYEAIYLEDIAEIMDEAIGLIRTAQQFSDSKRVMTWWVKVLPDVKKVLSNKSKFNKEFIKWKRKKTKKGQAKGVTAQSLINFAKLFR